MAQRKRQAADQAAKLAKKGQILSPIVIEGRTIEQKRGLAKDDREQRIAELERMVGRLAMELEMSKKVSSLLNSDQKKSGSW